MNLWQCCCWGLKALSLVRLYHCDACAVMSGNAAYYDADYKRLLLLRVRFWVSMESSVRVQFGVLMSAAL